MLNRLFQILRLFAPNRELANESQKLGELGERAAAGYLRKIRYKVVETNVTTAGGEIDLVAVDGRVVVFVEVKTRRSKKKRRALGGRRSRQTKKTAAPCRSLFETGRFE